MEIVIWAGNIIAATKDTGNFTWLSINGKDCTFNKYCPWRLTFTVSPRRICPDSDTTKPSCSAASPRLDDLGREPNTQYAHMQTFNDALPGTTQVGQYQKKHSPTHTHSDHQISFINFRHLLRSTASALINWSAWQSWHQSRTVISISIETLNRRITGIDNQTQISRTTPYDI